MEAVAENPHRFVVRASTEAIKDTSGALVVPAKRHVFIQFTRGSCPPWAAKTAVEHFRISRENLAGTIKEGVTPEQWACFYDSEAAQKFHNWNDEERAAIEAHLPNCPDILIVSRPTPQAPYKLWPKHRQVQGRRTLEHVFNDIREAYTTAGFDAAAAVTHERETLNDERVIEFLEGLAATADEPVDEIVAA